ncbi:MAG: type IV pilin protein, partial [Rhodocyclaceae bacterium]|nr:type IV pilin protein [Rhodocyclaceae bacterium]
MKINKGFTLIEVMIVVVIIGILASIAFPSYQEYVRRGNRSAAQAQMMDIASRQQQFFLANRQYASKAELEASGYGLPTEVASKYSYTITVGAGNPPSFVINFTAIGAQVPDGNLSLDSNGVKTP